MRILVILVFLIFSLGFLDSEDCFARGSGGDFVVADFHEGLIVAAVLDLTESGKIKWSRPRRAIKLLH